MSSPKTLSFLSDSNSKEDFRSILPLCQSDAEAKLREEEDTVVPLKELGVSHYDIVRVASNYPVEDDLIHGALTITGNEVVPDRTVMFWGIFDGHEGWEMSTKLRISLIDYVSRELNTAYQTSPIEAREDALSKAIETAFYLDDTCSFQRRRYQQ